MACARRGRRAPCHPPASRRPCSWFAPGRPWPSAHVAAGPLATHLLRDRSVLDRLLLDLSISVTSMFRDPSFYRAMREKVVPLMRTYPFLRVWNAGCSTGEETYSLAILFQEEGLADRTRIYATDINDVVLQRGKAGF